MSALPETGIYVIEIRLDAPRTIRVGRLGVVSFQAGAYLYVGSAVRSLRSRIARHARRTKPLRWHIDYLTRWGRVVRVLVWPPEKRLECEIAGALHAQLPVVKGFGASDCKCPGHLYFAATRAATDLLQAPICHDLSHTG
jgi:Uri superfamily endonuclease